MTEHDVIKDMTNSTDIQEVELDDTISVGCDHCGSCCMNSQVRLTAYDLDRMANVYDVKDIVDDITLYYGDNSHLPIVGLFSSEQSGLCPYLQSDLNGDFQCTLGEYKPSICCHPFVAIATQLDHEAFEFVPFDEEVEDFNIEEFLEHNRIGNNKLYYIKERSDACKSKCKKEVTVRDYISPKFKDEDARNLAALVPMLYSKYFDVKIMTKILHLAENSKVNGPLDDLFKGDSKLSQLSKTLFTEAYFYMEDPDKCKCSFYEQTMKQIHKLEHKLLPKYRILYKYLLKVFGEPDQEEFNNIMNEDDYNVAQKMFDKYFYDHLEEIKDLFFKEMIPNMTRELKECLRKMEAQS